MTTNLKILIIYVLIYLTGCSNKSEPQQPTTDEEYEIYSSVIDSLYKKDLNIVYIIPDSTDIEYITDHIRFSLNGKFIDHTVLQCLNNDDSIWSKSDHQELRKSFETNNDKRYAIDINRFKVSVTVKHIPIDSLVNIFHTPNKDGWEYYRQMFPKSGGLLSFSRIGFNKKKNQCVLYHGCTRGGLDGSGKYILLYKTKKGWIIKSIGHAWVS